MTTHLDKHDQASGNCHNCGAAVSYHYCALCGQETRLHVASAGEFIHEFVGHYVALEGRLWTTLHKLMCRPGFLTAEYIAGRRQRYVQPLRVYLTFSILFFFIIKLAGTPVAQVDQETDAARQVASASQQDSEFSAQGAVLMDLSPALAAKIQRFNARPAPEQSRMLQVAFFSYVPYAMFFLMPVFALYLKLLYFRSHRHYGEHLLFALHANAFAFAMFILLFLASFADVGLLSFAMAIWLIVYLPLAMRRVYGGKWPATVLRWSLLAALHLISIGAGILAAYGLAILA